MRIVVWASSVKIVEYTVNTVIKKASCGVSEVAAFLDSVAAVRAGYEGRRADIFTCDPSSCAMSGSNPRKRNCNRV